MQYTVVAGTRLQVREVESDLFLCGALSKCFLFLSYPSGGQCTHAWALMTGCKYQYTMSKNPKTGKFICTAKYNPHEKKWAKHSNSPHDSDPSMWRVEWPKVGGGGSVDLELTEDELFLRMVAWDKTNYIGKISQCGSLRCSFIFVAQTMLLYFL